MPYGHGTYHHDHIFQRALPGISHLQSYLYSTHKHKQNTCQTITYNCSSYAQNFFIKESETRHFSATYHCSTTYRQKQQRLPFSIYGETAFELSPFRAGNAEQRDAAETGSEAHAAECSPAFRAHPPSWLRRRHRPAGASLA